MDAVNQVTGNTMAQGIGAMSSGAGGSGSVGGFAYPLVVQREADGAITGTLGAWMMLEALTARTAPEVATPPAPARYGDYLRAAPDVRRKPRNYFAKKAQAPMFAAPLTDAPQVQRLDKGEGFAIEGVSPSGGEDWIAVRAFTTGEALKWGRLADFYTH
ncbi:hypothetical protein [Albirhodobacter sp. R86504]|uniref:hypothetical protein n=1 Tax=Albirhodobacter sp. R86504 TaxID=3093848 RepID=UPI00366C17FD